MPRSIELSDDCSLAKGITCLGTRGEDAEIVLEVAFGDDLADPDFVQRVVVEPSSPLLTFEPGSMERVSKIDQGVLVCWLLNSTLPGCAPLPAHTLPAHTLPTHGISV